MEPDETRDFKRVTVKNVRDVYTMNTGIIIVADIQGHTIIHTYYVYTMYSWWKLCWMSMDGDHRSVAQQKLLGEKWGVEMGEEMEIFIYKIVWMYLENWTFQSVILFWIRWANRFLSPLFFFSHSNYGCEKQKEFEIGDFACAHRQT